ncbi:MAG: hypothetical protein GXP16_12375 [Gammaproteobacteria bacterium]|nr:hypothetical protein [Gammaproteobacteria bacterium]
MVKPKTPFPSTQWLDLKNWRAATSDERRRLLERFYLRYRAPLMGFVAANGYVQDAEDIVQEFVIQQIKGKLFDNASAQKGRFRDLLLRALKNHMASRYRAERARKRHPEGGFAVLDTHGDVATDTDSPERKFEQDWVRSVIDNSMLRLQEEFLSKGQEVHLACLRARLVDPILNGSEVLSVTLLATTYDLTESQISNFVVTAKRALMRHLRNEVMEYADSRKETAIEMQNIVQFLTQPNMAGHEVGE